MDRAGDAERGQALDPAREGRVLEPLVEDVGEPEVGEPRATETPAPPLDHDPRTRAVGGLSALGQAIEEERGQGVVRGGPRTEQHQTVECAG
jgi:hypothetical protein